MNTNAFYDFIIIILIFLRFCYRYFNILDHQKNLIVGKKKYFMILILFWDILLSIETTDYNKKQNEENIDY